MTNADKIRSMTNEELAMYLSAHFDCYGCPFAIIEDIWNVTYCTGKHNYCMLNLQDWLKQEVEEE